MFLLYFTASSLHNVLMRKFKLNPVVVENQAIHFIQHFWYYKRPWQS